MIEELARTKISVAELHALDDERNLGRPSRTEGERGAALKTSDVAAFDFSRVDLAFFCGRAALERALCRSGGRACLGDRQLVDVSRREPTCRWWWPM